MQVAVADLVHLAHVVLEQSRRFAGERIDVGGQLVTGNEIARTLEREMGRSGPLQRVVVPESVIRSDPIIGESAAAMVRWLDSDGSPSTFRHCTAGSLKSRGSPSTTGLHNTPGVDRLEECCAVHFQEVGPGWASVAPCSEGCVVTTRWQRECPDPRGCQHRRPGPQPRQASRRWPNPMR